MRLNLRRNGEVGDDGRRRLSSGMASLETPRMNHEADTLRGALAFGDAAQAARLKSPRDRIVATSDPVRLK